MKARYMFNAHPKGNTAVIRVDQTNQTLLFIGASVSASAQPFTSGVTEVSLSVPTDQNGMVAVKTTVSRSFKEGGNQYLAFMVPFFWTNGKLCVDLDDPFISPSDRLGQINDDGDLIVTTADGQRFTTCRDQWKSPQSPWWDEKKKKAVAEGYRIVEDANLLCRFLVGQATLEELQAAATMDQRSFLELVLARTQEMLAETQTRHQSELERCETLLNVHRRGFHESDQLLKESNRLLETSEAANARLTENIIGLEHQRGLQEGGVAEILENRGNWKTPFGFLSRVKVRKIKALFRPTGALSK